MGHYPDMRIEEEARDELRRLAMIAAKDALARLRALHDADHRFADRTSYPQFDEGHEGLTYRTTTWSSGSEAPKRHISVFGRRPGYGTEILYEELDGYSGMLNLVLRHPALHDYLAPPHLGDDLRDHVLSVQVADLPLEMAERHIHSMGWELDERQLGKSYEQMEAWWLQESLPVELLIPILAIQFGQDVIKFSDGCRVEPLQEAEQLARWPGQRGHGLEKVLAMSTHVLVVPGLRFSNESALAWFVTPGAPDESPQTDRFFQALAAVTETPSGYAQVVYRPLGWSSGYTAALPPLLSGPVVERFSRRLDRTRSEPAQVLDTSDIDILRRAYNGLGNDTPTRLAAFRLRSADLREGEADRILDLCIGIEALVAGEPGDTTYKIAWRTAAVLAHRRVEAPSEFINAMKAIYGYRSALVHGRSRRKVKPILVWGQEWPHEPVARFVLRQLVLARIDDPSLTTDKVDRVLAEALESWAARDTASRDDGASH